MFARLNILSISQWESEWQINNKASLMERDTPAAEMQIVRPCNRTGSLVQFFKFIFIYFAVLSIMSSISIKLTEYPMHSFPQSRILG